jgi:hypothetical protein
MSGEESYRRQQCDPASASVPVILVTGAPPKQRSTMGDIRVIRRPFDLLELRFAIHRVISRESRPWQTQ